MVIQPCNLFAQDLGSKLPRELRPIVLSPTVAKVFTKALMLRLRSKLPPIRACQVGGIAGRQTLDSVCAVQHAIKLAEEYNKTLFVIKLDITAAFDSLAHEALAAFLAEASGCREAELLLEIITNTRVTLSMQGTTWEQALSQGVLQGSSYSAELFARCVDYYLAKTSSSWQEHEVTWLQSSDGRKIFLTPFADDLIILGTSREQAQRLLRDIEDTVNAIGLHFNAKKCKFLRPPGMSDRPLHLRNGQPIQAQDSLVFLGVLLAFNLTCYAVVAARMTQVSFRVLRQAAVGLVQRLRVFNCFVTSRWRWMSPTFRPIKAVRDFFCKPRIRLSSLSLRGLPGTLFREQLTRGLHVVERAAWLHGNLDTIAGKQHMQQASSLTGDMLHAIAPMNPYRLSWLSE